ncbi:hypothetical protein Droror1_Dr00025836 [Drosera rotundifolia]
MSQYVSKIPKHIQSKEEKGKKIAAIEAEEEVAEITGDGDRETRLVGGGSRRHGAASDGRREETLGLSDGAGSTTSSLVGKRRINYIVLFQLRVINV